MAGWLSIHRVSNHARLRTTEQMVAETVRAAHEAGLDGPSHQALEAAVLPARGATEARAGAQR